MADALPAIGYVVKRYPRYSETFIVSEILAHEAAGARVEIFALRPPCDTHFQDAIARVRAPVTYLGGDGVKPEAFWTALQEALGDGPMHSMSAAAGADARDVYQAALLAAEIKRRGVQHLHAHFATLPAVVARLAARFTGIGYTFTAHAKDIYADGHSREDLARKLREADAVVTVSDFNVAYLRDRFGADAAGVRRVYNGLDLARFAYDEPVSRPPIVLSVGRLVPKKGIPCLVEALAVLRERGVPCEGRIIGAGPDEADIAARIAARGLQSSVKLLGPQPGQEVMRQMRDAAVFAAPCVVSPDGDRDGLPTVLLESMALGTPCVGTDVTGIPELIRHDDTGLLAPQRDPAALADAIERLLSQPPLRVRLARRARAHMEAEFDGRINAARLRRLFAESMARRAPAAMEVG